MFVVSVLCRCCDCTNLTVYTGTTSVVSTIASEDLPDLRSLSVGGEAVPLALMQQMSRAGRHFFNLYGPTEVTVMSNAKQCDPKMKKMTIGKVIASYKIYILDSEMQPVPIGVPGILYIGGVGVARGMLPVF